MRLETGLSYMRFFMGFRKIRKWSRLGALWAKGSRERRWKQRTWPSPNGGGDPAFTRQPSFSRGEPGVG